jgi:hypothetical protein
MELGYFAAVFGRSDDMSAAWLAQDAEPNARRAAR